MLSFLYVYSDHSILECYNLFSGVELSMRSFFVIIITIMYSAKPLFVSASLLAIRFLNIKIDVNFKNLFGINFFSNFYMLDKE